MDAAAESGDDAVGEAREASDPQGAHPKLIQQRLGHSAITITLDRYGHLLPSLETALAEQLDAAYEAATAASNVVTLAQ